MTEIIIPAAKRLKAETNNIMCYQIPEFVLDYYLLFVEQQEEKNIHFDKLKISKPFKQRTTGKHSQNHHINGHIAQIANITGMDFDTLKSYFKRLAIKRKYPFDTAPDGEAEPWSERRIDTTQAGYLIDEIHQFADENNITLKEDGFGIL